MRTQGPRPPTVRTYFMDGPQVFYEECIYSVVNKWYGYGMGETSVCLTVVMVWCTDCLCLLIIVCTDVGGDLAAQVSVAMGPP